MVINLSQFGKHLNLLYKDKFSIYRYSNVENADGTTSLSLKKTPEYFDEICRVSFRKEDETNQTIGMNNPLDLGIKIFCSIALDIQKGDFIVADRFDDDGNKIGVYSGYANESFKYSTHQEISLTKEGDA